MQDDHDIWVTRQADQGHERVREDTIYRDTPATDTKKAYTTLLLLKFILER